MCGEQGRIRPTVGVCVWAQAGDGCRRRVWGPGDEGLLPTGEHVQGPLWSWALAVEGPPDEVYQR